MIITRSDITAGLPETEQTQPYVLQTTSRKTLSVLKEVLVELTPGQRYSSRRSMTSSSWAGCHACLQCVCGFGVPHATTE